MELVGHAGTWHASKLATKDGSPFSDQDIIASVKSCSEYEEYVGNIVNTLSSKSVTDVNYELVEAIVYAFQNTPPQCYGHARAIYVEEFKKRIHKLRHFIGCYSAIINKDVILNDKTLLEKTAKQLFEEYINLEFFESIYDMITILEAKIEIISDQIFEKELAFAELYL